MRSPPTPWEVARLLIPLVVQWLRHHAANEGGASLIPGQGTKAIWSGQKIKKIYIYPLKSLRKGRRTRDQIANISWITEKAREFQKNIYFSFIDYAKA